MSGAGGNHKFRRKAGATLTVLGVITFVIGAFVAPAGASHSTTSTEQGVTPTYVGGNPKCAPDEEVLRIPGVPENKTYDGTFGNTAWEITIENSNGFSFDWETNGITLGAVIVKASNGGNVYAYDPPVTSDEGLQSPHTNNNTGTNQAQISHVSFCFGDVDLATGTITVSKTVVDQVGNGSETFEFTVTCDDDPLDTFSLGHDEDWTSPDLAVGTECTVEETGETGWSTSYKIDGGTKQSGTSAEDVPVDEGDTAVAFTNTRSTSCCTVVITPPETGSLTLSKTVVNGEGGESFDFLVECGDSSQIVSLGDGGEVTIDDILVGTECTVTEDEPEDTETVTWTVTIADSDGTADDGVVVVNGDETVDFTNERAEVAGVVVERPPAPAPQPEPEPEPAPEPTVLPAAIERELPRTGVETRDLMVMAGIAILLGGLMLLAGDRMKLAALRT